MITSITDYENWRDGLYDNEQDGEWMVFERKYSHDYDDDTRLECWIAGENRMELRIFFASEDPDAGTEEEIYGGNMDETMNDEQNFRALARELRQEITASLDAHEGYTTQSDPYYDNHTRTALYAYEAILLKLEEED